LESDEVAAVIPTSGSTGAPRGVLLSAASLTALTEHVHGLDADGRPARPQWVLALPVTSMGGVNVLVRALQAGRDPVIVPSIGGAGPFTAHDFVTAVGSAARVTDDVRVSLVPAQLARLLADEAGIAALQQCREVLVGGAATRASLRESAAALGIRVVTTYGATETAGGCVLDGRPLPGVLLTVDGDPGPVTIGGPSVALGYRGEPELTRVTFGPDGYRTADLGRLTADGRLAILGRIDDVVVVRGVNVSPSAIEHVAADLPDVAAAAAVVIDDADGEPAVHVFVELRDDASPAHVEEAVREAVVTHLGRAARPVVRRVVHLPHLPNGKVDRRLLQEQATQADDITGSGEGS
jgi:O-succinylbenzoic acid--CoA ligase